MVVMNGAFNGSLGSDKVSLTLRCIHGDSIVSIRCRKSVKSSALITLYSYFTGINYDGIRLVHKGIQLEEGDTIGQIGIEEGDIVDVYHVLSVVEFDNYEQWICE